MPRSRVWGWIRSAAVVIGLLGLLAAWFGIWSAARDGRQPWQSIAWVVAALFYAWRIVSKLTSSKPVDQDWDGHIRFTLVSLVPVVVGVASLVRGGSWWARPAGALSLFVGTVLLVAEYLDFRRWRVIVGEDRFFAAQKARGRAPQEVPPAGGPEAKRPSAW